MNNPYKYYDPSGHMTSMFMDGMGSTTVWIEDEKKKKKGKDLSKITGKKPVPYDPPSTTSSQSKTNTTTSNKSTTELQQMAYDLGYDGGNSNKSNSTLTKEKEAIAKQLGYEAPIAAKEEETGKFEADEVGVSDGIVKPSTNDDNLNEKVISFSSEVIEKSPDIFKHILGEEIDLHGIEYDAKSSEILKAISKDGEELLKILNKHSEIVEKYGKGLGVIVDSLAFVRNVYEDIEKGETVKEAIIHNVIVMGTSELIGLKSGIILGGYIGLVFSPALGILAGVVVSSIVSSKIETSIDSAYDYWKAVIDKVVPSNISESISPVGEIDWLYD